MQAAAERWAASPPNSPPRRKSIRPDFPDLDHAAPVQQQLSPELSPKPSPHLVGRERRTSVPAGMPMFGRARM
ncbi:hypothetical protein M885DRAFT_508497 [Pelagophyceae sp. CCMP2097]|nr:hypothetical protein M885DRAFT_508497 [Pelagophyceae sp. CCMP2097]